MKKTIILLIAFIPLLVLGQDWINDESLVTYSNPSSEEYVQKIKVYHQNILISLSQRQGNDYFFSLLQNANSAIAEAFANNSEKIKDMEILDDTLYFCGENSNGGFIGKASISDLFFGNNNYQTTNIVGTDIINKIKVYHQPSDENIIHVVGIGEMPSYSCFVDLTNDKYIVERSQYQISSLALFEDIDITEKYVTTVSKSISSANMFIVRSYDKNDPTDINSQQKIIFNYSGILSSYFITGGQYFHIKALDNNNIVIASNNYNYALTADLTIFNFIDLYNISNISYNQIVYHQNKALQIRDMVYSETEKKLLVLEQDYFGDVDGKETVLHIEPNTAVPYNTHADYIFNKAKLNAIDIFPNNTKYAVSGIYNGLNSEALYFIKDMDISYYNCDKETAFTVTDINIGTTISALDLAYVSSYLPIWNTYNANMQTEILNIDCESNY